MRKRNFQAQIVKLSCGHFVSIVTNFFRLQKDRLGCLRGVWIRKGVYCPLCKSIDQPEEWTKICNENKADFFIAKYNKK